MSDIDSLGSFLGGELKPGRVISDWQPQHWEWK